MEGLLSLEEVVYIINDIEAEIQNNNINKNKLEECLNKIENSFQELTNLSKVILNCSDKCLQIKTSILKKQEEEKEKEKNNQVKITNLSDLMKIMKNINFEQYKRLLKISPDDKEYSKVYLQNFTKNTDAKKANLLGIINILGQYNFTKKERENYNIKVFNNNNECSLWCSCIDHKLNSTKKQTVCKHISFIVCKVMKIYDLQFFESKKLKDAQLESLLDRFSDKSDLWDNKSFIMSCEKLSFNSFKIFPAHLDDTCIFCYDELCDKDKEIIVSCPTCKHCYHYECIDIWLENYSRCSVCSSTIWQYYKKVKGGSVIPMNEIVL
jgi:hypothetical protein